MRITAMLGGFGRRKARYEPTGRDDEMVPLWTAEDEIALARRVARAEDQRLKTWAEGRKAYEEGR